MTLMFFKLSFYSGLCISLCKKVLMFEYTQMS